MKLEEITFNEKVSFNDMLVMAGQIVESIYGEPEQKLNRVLGQEYLYLQGATRLFTTYGTRDEDGDPEEFMGLVFAMGVGRFERWLEDGAGKEKYQAFKRMVERGMKEYADMRPIDVLIRELSGALHVVNETGDQLRSMSPKEMLGELLAMAREAEEKDALPEE